MTISPTATVANVVLDHSEAELLMKEHEGVLELLSRIRNAADDYTLPGWACTSYRTLFSELQQLEAIAFARLHLENNVLLPRLAS